MHVLTLPTQSRHLPDADRIQVQAQHFMWQFRVLLLLLTTCLCLNHQRHNSCWLYQGLACQQLLPFHGKADAADRVRAGTKDRLALKDADQLIARLAAMDKTPTEVGCVRLMPGLCLAFGRLDCKHMQDLQQILVLRNLES